MKVRRWRGRAAALGLALAMGSAAAAVAAAGALAEEPPGRRITLEAPGREAVSLYYEEQGSGPPLLLLHGLGESLFTWHEIAPALAARYRVITLDLKGFGRSDKPQDGAYAADDQAALVARFLIERGLEGVSIVGHSFGGTVALRTGLAEGIRGTPRIARIAVIGAPALPRSTPRYFDLVKAPLLPDTLVSALSPEAMARLLLREAMGGEEDASEEMVEGYAAPYRDPAAMTAFLATARAIVNEEGPKEIARRYRALSQPVLVVWCRKDPIVPLRAGRRVTAAIPHARLKILEGCHHLPQHERPKELLRALDTFLDK